MTSEDCYWATVASGREAGFCFARRAAIWCDNELEYHPDISSSLREGFSCTHGLDFGIIISIRARRLPYWNQARGSNRSPGAGERRLRAARRREKAPRILKSCEPLSALAFQYAPRIVRALPAEQEEDYGQTVAYAPWLHEALCRDGRCRRCAGRCDVRARRERTQELARRGRRGRRPRAHGLPWLRQDGVRRHRGRRERARRAPRGRPHGVPVDGQLLHEVTGCRAGRVPSGPPALPHEAHERQRER